MENSAFVNIKWTLKSKIGFYSKGLPKLLLRTSNGEQNKLAFLERLKCCLLLIVRGKNVVS